jgi:hypothetical protein
MFTCLQQGEESQDRRVRAGEAEQGIQIETAGQDIQNGISRTGHPERDKQDRTSRTG